MRSRRPNLTKTKIVRFGWDGIDRAGDARSCWLLPPRMYVIKNGTGYGNTLYELEMGPKHQRETEKEEKRSRKEKAGEEERNPDELADWQRVYSETTTQFIRYFCAAVAEKAKS